MWINTGLLRVNLSQAGLVWLQKAWGACAKDMFCVDQRIEDALRPQIAMSSIATPKPCIRAKIAAVAVTKFVW